MQSAAIATLSASACMVSAFSHVLTDKTKRPVNPILKFTGRLCAGVLGFLARVAKGIDNRLDDFVFEFQGGFVHHQAAGHIADVLDRFQMVGG